MRSRRKRKSLQKVQLTALVDAFTILIVFFLFQFSADPENIQPEDRVNLPVAENAYATQELKNVNVIISDRFIKINDEEVLRLSAGEILSGNLHKLDSEFIESLYDKIQNEKIQEEKEHQWVILADEKIPYETVKKTIYTLAVSGFTKIKLASTVEFK